MTDITITSDPNQEVIFHPVDDDKKAVDERQKIAQHVSEHYRKYLFGVGALFGLMISLVARMAFGTNFTVNQTNAADITADTTTDIAYQSLVPEVKAIIIFNQMDAIAHEKDNFFHGTGKIYTLSGDTLFHKYDSMYHVLDNAYHRSIDTQEKLKRAKRLENFINVQNKIFAATEYTNPAEDQKFAALDQEFLQMLGQMTVNETLTGQALTGDQIIQ